MKYMGRAANRPQKAPAWSKRCTNCPAVYSLAEWRALPAVGNQDDGTEFLELRNCPCGSTLEVEVARPQPPAPPPVERDQTGRCCGAAKTVRCVCVRSWECPVHGGHCIGGH